MPRSSPLGLLRWRWRAGTESPANLNRHSALLPRHRTSVVPVLKNRIIVSRSDAPSSPRSTKSTRLASLSSRDDSKSKRSIHRGSADVIRPLQPDSDFRVENRLSGCNDWSPCFKPTAAMRKSRDRLRGSDLSRQGGTPAREFKIYGPETILVRRTQRTGDIAIRIRSLNPADRALSGPL